ncbi:MAG: SpoIIE family protein phosphatase [Candidatus Kapaibacterium sp.]
MQQNESTQLDTNITEYKIKVLLVDDQAIVGEQVRRMLQPEEDIEFHFCQEPSKAVQTAAELNPTVILQDLVMPDIDGLTLVKFFRAHPQLKDVPMIVLSSKEEAVTKADSFATGANDYLVKLPDRIELVARIRYHSKGYIHLLQRNEAEDKLRKSQKALLSELAKAGEYCVSLLPEEIDEGDIRTHWRFVPSEQLGGDSFGYHWVDDDHFAMYLLDVCGHGVGSALLSVSGLNAMRMQSLPNTDFRSPESVCNGLNAAFQMEAHNDMYFTLWYGVYNKNSREMKFATAGHPPALLYDAAGNCKQLMNENFIIGGLPEFPYSESSTEVAPGSRMYIYSDGVYEITRPDGSMWDLDGLEDYMREPHDGFESEIEALHRHVQSMSGLEILDDDFSMLKIIFD